MNSKKSEIICMQKGKNTIRMMIHRTFLVKKCCCWKHGFLFCLLFLKACPLPTFHSSPKVCPHPPPSHTFQPTSWSTSKACPPHPALSCTLNKLAPIFQSILTPSGESTTHHHKVTTDHGKEPYNQIYFITNYRPWIV